jgi:Fe-Mn family superoxide dismutase
MAIELPALPYEKNALEPIISAETLDFHHGKHHNAYVVNLNNLIKDTDLASKSLEEIIQISAGDAPRPAFSITLPRSGTTRSTGTA